MKVVLQRVKEASVTIDGKVNGEIGQGFMLLVGFADGDGPEQIDYIARKIANTRLFEDEAGKMNLNLSQVDGEILSVSQFTLYADTKKGNRPSFAKAQAPELAKTNYELFNEKLRQAGFKVATGIFGADMDVALINDGPVTIIFEAETVS